MSIGSRILRSALEELSDGKARKEIEYEFFARLLDLRQLEHAIDFEMHEQWQIFIPKTEENAAKGTMRVRKTIKNDGDTPQYAQTTKTALDSAGGRIETTIPSTESGFRQFMIMCHSGMMKDRYTFGVQDSPLVWHLDMHYVPGTKAGEKKYTQWCRLELEVPDHGTLIPPMPFEFEEVITAQKGKRTPEEESRIKSLFEHEFLLPNPYKG